MRSSHGLDRLDVAFDGAQLVADAGLHLPATKTRWPWTADWTRALTRLRAIPLLA